MIIKLCKCHRYYLLNKLFIIVFVIITILNIIYNLFIALSIDNYVSLMEKSKFYYLSTYQIFRLEILLLTLITCSFSFISSNDQYRSLILTSNISRNKFVITKIITIFSVLFVITIIEGLIIMVIACICDIDFYRNYFEIVYNLFISIIYFGLISILFVQISDSIYVMVGSFVLLLSTTLDIDSNFLKYFIVLINEDMKFFITSIYYLILCAIIFIINIIIYNKRDLQT